MILFRVLALLAFIFIPGWLAVSLLGRRMASLREEERLYLAWAAGAGLTALCVETLALASSYTLASLSLVVGSVTILLAMAARRRAFWLRDLGMARLLLVLALVASALVLYAPPGRIMLIGSDIGGYMNNAAKIVRQGELHSTYLTVKLVKPERRYFLFWPNFETSIHYAYEALTGPGYFVTDFQQGKVVPMFYYLWPSLLALFGSFLGLENMFWAITFVSVLALGGIFLLARRMLGNRWGFATLVLAALFPPMVFFSRYHTSEILTMNLFIAGSLCLTAFLQRAEEAEGKEEGKAGRESVGLAAAAACFFTLGFFCRIDFCLAVIPLVAFFLFKRVLGEMNAPDWWFLGLTLGGAAISLFVGAVFSRPYFYYTWHVTIVRWFWLFRFPGVLLIILILVSLALGFALGHRLRDRLRKLARLRKMGYVSIWLVLAAVFIYLYYVRSVKICPPETFYGVDPHGYSNANQGFVRWTWYFSFIGLVFIFLGYALWFTRARRYSRVPVALVGLMYTFIYAWNLNDAPFHYLCMRRLLPVIMPLAWIMISYVLKSMQEGAAWILRKQAWGPRAGKVLAGGFLLYFILYSVNVSVPLFGLREGGNQMEVCSDIADKVEEGGIVLVDAFSGWRFGVPLRCYHGVEEGWVLDNAYLEKEDFKALLGDLGFPDTPIYLLWWTTRSGEHVPLVRGLQLKDVGRFSWREEDMEITCFQRPAKRELISESLRLYRIVPQEI